jgi:hypothetical protein
MKKYFLGYTRYIYRVSLSLCSYGNKYPFILFIYLFIFMDMSHCMVLVPFPEASFE